MKTSAFVSDILFSFFVAFLPAACVFRFLRFPFPATLAIAFLFALAVSFLVFLYLRGKSQKAKELSAQTKSAKELFLSLALNSEEQNLELLTAYLSAVGESARTLLGTLPYAETEEKLYCPLFSFAPLRPDDIAEFLRKKTGKQKVLLSSALDEETESLCRRFAVETVTGNEVYTALKDKDLLPEPNESLPIPSKRSRKLRLWFKKSNSRSFFFGGILLLLTSLLTPFPLYYLIFGSVLLIVSVFVRVLGYR